MIKKRFPLVALAHFNDMDAAKLAAEIENSLKRLKQIKPRNQREELSLKSNHHRVEVLKIILKYQKQPNLRPKVEEIATLT